MQGTGVIFRELLDVPENISHSQRRIQSSLLLLPIANSSSKPQLAVESKDKVAWGRVVSFMEREGHSVFLGQAASGQAPLSTLSMQWQGAGVDFLWCSWCIRISSSQLQQEAC
jgi:hypothetical protein